MGTHHETLLLIFMVTSLFVVLLYTAQVAWSYYRKTGMSTMYVWQALIVLLTLSFFFVLTWFLAPNGFMRLQVSVSDGTDYTP